MKMYPANLFAACLCFLFLYPFAASGEPSTGDEDAMELLDQIETPYNNIFIYGNKNLVSMRFKRYGRSFNESTLNVNNPRDLPLSHYKLMPAGLLYVDDPESMLMVGLGGGVTSMYIHRYLASMNITAVEIDPGVIDAAKKYFGVAEDSTYSVVAADGRIFLVRSPGSFDIIIIDAYRGGYVPFHLTTREFYLLVEKRLKKGGCVVINSHAGSRLFDSTIATVRSVFENMDAFKGEGNNAILVAYHHAEKSAGELEEKAKSLQENHGFYHDIREILNARYQVSADSNAVVLTDDFSPANYLNAIERHNEPRW